MDSCACQPTWMTWPDFGPHIWLRDIHTRRPRMYLARVAPGRVIGTEKNPINPTKTAGYKALKNKIFPKGPRVLTHILDREKEKGLKRTHWITKKIKEEFVDNYACKKDKSSWKGAVKEKVPGFLRTASSICGKDTGLKRDDGLGKCTFPCNVACILH